MNRLAKYFASVAAASLLAACANLGGNEIHVAETRQLNPDAPKVKNSVAVRIGAYADARGAVNPRRIGIAEARVIGLSGKDLVLDRDAADVVTDSLSARLDDSGLRALAKDDPEAQFELSGVIRELKYDVKARDFVTIKLESTLKEIASGKEVWHGEVEQKNDRFAGISGNSLSDIASNLKRELGVATGKTAEAINSALMAKYPEKFNLTPGTKAIPGVTVFVAPNGQGSIAPDSAMLKPMHEAPGTLVVRTEPARAKVYLDGVYFGLSPLNVESAAGVRTVEVKLKGYKSASEKVAVRVGALTELEFQLEK
jgi:hypothetical protein